MHSLEQLELTHLAVTTRANRRLSSTAVKRSSGSSAMKAACARMRAFLWAGLPRGRLRGPAEGGCRAR